MRLSFRSTTANSILGHTATDECNVLHLVARQRRSCQRPDEPVGRRIILRTRTNNRFGGLFATCAATTEDNSIAEGLAMHTGHRSLVCAPDA